MVEAATGIGEALEAADFHLVDATATGAHAERAENRLLRLDWLDSEDLGSAAPAAQRDFVFVGGPPTLQRRAVEHGAGLATCTRRRPPLALRGRQRIRRPEHGKTMRTRSLCVNRPTVQPVNLHRVAARASASPFRSFLLTMLPIRFGPHSNIYASAHTEIWNR